jgi:hypothetical protein
MKIHPFRMRERPVKGPNPFLAARHREGQRDRKHEAGVRHDLFDDQGPQRRRGGRFLDRF